MKTVAPATLRQKLNLFLFHRWWRRCYKTSRGARVTWACANVVAVVDAVVAVVVVVIVGRAVAGDRSIKVPFLQVFFLKKRPNCYCDDAPRKIFPQIFVTRALLLRIIKSNNDYFLTPSEELTKELERLKSRKAKAAESSETRSSKKKIFIKIRRSWH